MKTIYINGKYCAQRTTGVQRLAASLVQALDEKLAAMAAPAERWALLCPQGSALPRLQRIEVHTVGTRRFGLHAWEQLVLPLATRGQPLLNLAGPAPLFKRRQACLIADAAVFDRPDAYTRTFAAWYRFLFKQLARRATLLLTISQFSSSRLTRWLAVPNTRLKVVHCGATHIGAIEADAGTGSALGLTDLPYLLVVASVNPTKNLRRLLEAFRAVERPDIRLVMVGGSNAAVFADDTKSIADERIVRTGPVDDRQLKWLYEHATGFVFPSTYEGFGLPPLEAMACGCPVIASTAASIPEVCGDAALYVDPESPADMAAAMRRVVDDSALREDLRQRGRQRASLFTWALAGSQLLGHLQSAGIVEGRAA